MNLSKPQKLIYNMEKVVGGSIAVICGSMLFSGEVSLCAIKQAINEIYRINDALRIHISESDGDISQTVSEYVPKEIDVLQFADKAALDVYAEEYAKKSLDFHGELSEFKIILLPDRCGVLVKMHHIIGDAWALSLIGSQINALLHGETPEAFSYTDYLETENSYLNSKRYEKDRWFFRDQFKKCDEVTYLSEKQSSSFRANRKTLVICADDAKRIADYAAERKTSAFVLFTSALAAYMNRVKMNAEKFYIGTAVLNRATEKEKNTVGMFINTVPMFIELNNKKTFAENLSSMMDTVFSVFRHQKYNYGDVIADLRKKYDFSERLYDVIISYQNATVTGDAVETTWYPCGFQVESLQIHIDNRDNEGVFRIHYDYLTDKFTEHDMEMLHAHLLNLLFSAINDDSKKIYELNLLTADEQQKLLVDFNDTAVDYPREKCIHTLFEEQAAKTPDKTAVIAFDKTLTYKELNEEANRIAHGLIVKGIGVGDIVAFALPRKSYLISTIFGILKSGAAYLPIDPDYPQDRIEYMLTDSKAKAFITEQNINELLDNESTANPDITMSSESLCYCIYTSGSTGIPKGALLKHRGIVNLVTDLNIYSDLSQCNRIGFMTTITFDVATQEIFTALLNGFTGVLLSERSQTGLNDIIDNVVKNHIDVIYATTTYFDSLTYSKEMVDRLFSAVKVVCLAGEKFGLNSNVLACENYDIIFENQYGPAEVHVITTTTTINPYEAYNLYDSFRNTDEKLDQEVGFDIHIGKPIANTQIYIVDSYMNPTPIGVMGELCIAGDGVGAGYLNRPELTAEKFIDNPFGEGKLYKTGDLAYWREDGNIVYVGRNDFQVKIRGLRVELGEIENAISSVGGISQSVVIVRKNNEGRQLICAFYTGKETDPKEIRAQIGKKLPKYMLPHIFTHLDDMPLTTSGKINRKALPEVDLYAADTTVEYIAPQTEKEKVLASAIAQILKIEKVGLADDFFDLGGDSLKAIELISKLEKLGYQTDTKTIFACDTVKKLAEQLSVADKVEEDIEYPTEIQATPAQMRVYTAQSMNFDSTMYNVPYVFKAMEVDIDRLQKAINALLERHEILRTCFENKDGTIIQVVDEKAVCNVVQLASDNILAFIRPFDLSKAPLIRVGVYENTVMIDMHHIITDGSSMPVFLRELNELYMGRSLDATPVPYKRFAVMPQDHTASEQYWLEVYRDEVPELSINTDFKRGQKQSFNGSAIYDTIDIALHEQIQKYCKKQNITPYVFYMAAFNILLSKFSGCEDVVVGMPISGRDGKYLDTIGMFVNTIALRNKPVGTKTVEAFLREVKENSIAAIEHQDYPFGQLVKKLGLNTADRNPLFDVMFAYQSEHMTDVVFGDEKAELLPIPVTTSKYDFTFNILPREGNVVVMAEYCIDLYSERTIRRFVAGFKQVLEQMMSGGKLKELSVILPDEMQKLLYTFNDTAVDYPREKCIHTLFEEQAAKTPDKTAVIAFDKTLTYKELNEEANRIAHGLIVKGIGVGDIVAFALPRKSYLISTIFGILKSGAAYLPIDPDYPQDRIEYMLTDSKAKAFITEQNINELLDNESTANPDITMSSESLCYCIYTSGSTGIPKGALLKHRGIVNLVTDLNIYSDLSQCNRIGFMTTITFDVATQEIFTALLNGFTGVLLSERSQTGLNDIIDNVVKNHIDVIYATTTYFDSLTYSKEMVDRLFSAVKVVCLAGEKFGLNSNVLACENYDIIFENQYGPAEVHVITTTTTINPYEAYNLYDSFRNTDEKLDQEVGFDIHIGKPIANTQIYIVDSYMNPTPIGVMGELCIAGDGVGAGYLNRPELTAEKFIDNPFGEGKLYKTGDLAYWREDGNIVYVGRNDFQVKIRGLRVELGEIENAISSVGGISQSVVIVRKNNEGRQLICAFYTGKETDPKEIRAQIGKKLPKYMLPHIFTHLDDMPLTTSGKINRKALPEVDLYNIANDTGFVAPVTERQKELCKLMEEVLKTSPIGIMDDFFDLGCDSLKAIEFVSKAHSEGIYFNLQNIFNYPTVEKLCDCIESGDKQVISFADVDFSTVNALLAKNTVEQMKKPEKTEVGSILLAGATGYLGIHILADFLDHDSGIAYCIVRGKDQMDSEKRMADLLKFYFGDKYAKTDRIKVYCGDLSEEQFKLCDEDYTDLFGKVDTVINCAASVKHYGSYKYFYDVNVESIKRLIQFAKEAGAKLVHTSTLSVSGNSFADDFDGYISKEEKHFYESSLYIGQPLDNVYARSKFEAEKAVLDGMAEGLQANIMRMGFLTNRDRDGVFQLNYDSNALLKRIKAFLELGLIPDYLMSLYCEFAPIDEASNAVMTITRHFSTEQTVFHINSIKVVYLDKLVEYFNILGFDMKVVDGKTFTEALRQTAKQDGTEHIFETFITDMDENERLNYDSNIRIENDFTVQYLKQLGFEWKDIDLEYLRRYVEYFRKIGYI